MDSCIDISDFIGEDFEAAGINLFEFAPWTPDYLHFLGEGWIVASGEPDPDHALTLVTVMGYLADEADAGLCEALSFNERYRRRTQSLFGMSWAPTRDHGWEPSCGMERLAEYEIGWADYQLQSRHLRLFGFYVEASYMWTVLNRSNMNVEKILARRRVQPEPATAEDDEHLCFHTQPTLCISDSLPPLPSTLPMASSPSTSESTERFTPPSGTSTDDFLTDSHVIKSREPGTLIYDFSSLRHTERWALRDHLRLWLKVVDQIPAAASDLQITPEHRRRFAIKLFDSWSTSHGTSEIPESPTKKTKEHSRIPVSVWSQDLPLSGAAKRKRDDDKTPSPKKQKCSAARRKGTRAFVSITKTVGKGDDKIAFEFRDANSQLTTGEFIAFDHSTNLVVAKAQSLMQHDSTEVSHTRVFNERLIITTARNWIVEAARVGLKPGSDSDLNPMGEHEPASGAPTTYRLFLCITKRRKEHKNF